MTGKSINSLRVGPNATLTTRHTLLFSFTFTVFVTGAQSGCASYRKCGFRGCPGDAAITAEMRALFSQHPVLEPPNLLTMQTLDHMVYLYSVVDTDLEREIAESVALQAKGVAKVVNSIGISGNRKLTRARSVHTCPAQLRSSGVSAAAGASMQMQRRWSEQ